MLPNAVPKPAKREKTPPKPLQRKQWGVSSEPRQPLPAINARAAAKRSVKQRKHYASKEYKAAKQTAQARAQGRCEAIYARLLGTVIVVPFLPSDVIPSGYRVMRRCPRTEGLEFHETEYGSDVGILREIDGFILCDHDHDYIELTRHPTRHTRRK